MRRDVAATVARFSSFHGATIKTEQALRGIGGHLQASLHADRLRVFVHVDDVLPLAAARLRQLRSGVLHLGRAQEAAVLGEVAVSVSVLPLTPFLSSEKEQVLQ